MGEQRVSPTPWTYENHSLSEGYSSVVYDAHGHAVAGVHLSEPDARLIAAAPDLLEAARTALTFIKNDELAHNRTFASGIKLRAAIAKAEAQT